MVGVVVVAGAREFPELFGEGSRGRDVQNMLGSLEWTLVGVRRSLDLGSVLGFWVRVRVNGALVRVLD